MAGGRPSKYDSIDLKQVEKLARMGWTDMQMAEFFEVDVRTWHRWKGQHGEFCHSLKDWKDEADKVVERSLYERAIGYSAPEDKIFNVDGEALVVPTIKNYPPDTTAAIFWLKNRQKEQWRDKQEIDHRSGDGTMSPTRKASEMSDDELAAAIDADTSRSS